MSEKYDVALIGATGLVGEAIVSFLAERSFPVGNFFSTGKSAHGGTKN